MEIAFGIMQIGLPSMNYTEPVTNDTVTPE